MSTFHVGCRALRVEDPAGNGPVPVWVFHPTREAPKGERVGGYVLEVARDAAPTGDDCPLVVISHGTGSSPLVHRNLACHLAREGFVVVAIEHPGNNRDDNHLAFTLQNLEDRPRHVQLVIDALFADPAFAPHLSRHGVAVIGHSLGGYTALALAGGHPVTLPQESADGAPHPIEVVHDPRVRAIVLLAPAAAWFHPEGALADVEAGILLLTGEHDQHAPSFHGQLVARGVGAGHRMVQREVPNAGHFSFLSPFPPERTGPQLPPSQDPPGFDRAAFHAVLYPEITTFLREELASGGHA